ncbi:MAG: DinB family protein [Acidobacteria bacterium]|nr:DinB family protein [Acidobacteriota bacterium]
MDPNDVVRTHLAKVLSWQDAHVSFDAAIDGIPPEMRGVQPSGLPYSLWQLLEHLRICQWDILEFCRNPDYKEIAMEDYWPQTTAPLKPDSWEASIAGFRNDCEALKQLALDPQLDLFAKIPHGTGQTYLRELLLVADHNAYHVGQIVMVRRLLGIW